MTDAIEVVIVGAGQAGLAVSHELTQAGVAGPKRLARSSAWCEIAPGASRSRQRRGDA